MPASRPHRTAPKKRSTGARAERVAGRAAKRQPTAATPTAPATPPARQTKSGAPRIIRTEADIRDGMRALRRACPHMRRLHDLAGDPPLRRRVPGFEGLARIIVGQQVSVASANAIWQRTFDAVTPFEPARLLATTDEALRGAGLSRGKIKTLTAIARALTETGLDLDALDALTDAQIHDALTGISGIGPWTADVFIMFCLGRADAFASGDLALQVAAQRALDLGERPNPDALTAIAERWRPWRAVAARMLWAYYAFLKTQASAQPV